MHRRSSKSRGKWTLRSVLFLAGFLTLALLFTLHLLQPLATTPSSSPSSSSSSSLSSSVMSAARDAIASLPTRSSSHPRSLLSAKTSSSQKQQQQQQQDHHQDHQQDQQSNPKELVLLDEEPSPILDTLALATLHALDALSLLPPSSHHHSDHQKDKVSPESNAANSRIPSIWPSRSLLASKDGSRYAYIRGKKISARFCAYDAATRECDLEGYVFYLVGIFGPCVIIGVFCMLAIPVFLCVRTCCACCCSSSGSRYTKNTIIIVKVGLGILLLGVAMAFFFGYAGNKKASDGITGLTKVALQVGGDLVQRVRNIRTRIVRLSTAPPNSAADLQSAVDAGDDVLEVITDADKDVESVNSWRFAAINIGFIFPSIFALLSFGLGMANLRLKCIHLVFAMLVLFALFFLWISTGLHWLVEILVGDACFEARVFLFTPQATRQAENNPVESIFKCSPNSTDNPFYSFREVLNDGIDNAVRIACTALTEPNVGVCNLGVDCSNTGFPSVPCTESSLPSYSDSTLYSDRVGAPPAFVTLLACNQSSTPCVPGPNKTAADLLYASISDMVIYRNILRGDVEPLLACDFITQLFTAIDGVVCDDLVGGFTDIRSAQLAASILFLAAVVFMILGQKRFLPLSESAEEAEENQKEGVEGGGKKGKKGSSGTEMTAVAVGGGAAAAGGGAAVAGYTDKSFLGSSSSYAYSSDGSDYALPVYDAAVPAKPYDAPTKEHPPGYDSFDHMAGMGFDDFQPASSHNFAEGDPPKSKY